jgi:hypothetical protein
MIIHNNTKASKVAARVINEAGEINRLIEVTISEQAPESTRNTGTIPRMKGWNVMTEIPVNVNGRKDYVRFLKETKYREIWIRLSTSGGKSRIYVR